VRILRPMELDSAVLNVVAREGGHYIQVGRHFTRIDNSLDFDLNKFTNRFEWYDRETWRVVLPHL